MSCCTSGYDLGGKWLALEGAFTGDVLVVDDDSTVRRLVRGVLSATGYQTVEAEDGLAAYDLIRQIHATLRLVITDIRMPRMDGAELAERVEAEYPELKILCISGFTNALETGGRHFLAKPFSAKALRAMVEEVIGPPEFQDAGRA